MTLLEPREERIRPAEDGTEPTSPQSRRWRAIALVVVIGCIPALSVGWADTRLSTTNLVVSLGIVAWSGARLVVLATARPTQPFSVNFMAFVYVFVGVASLSQALASEYPLDGLDYPQSLVSRHLLALAIGLVAFEIGRAVTSALIRHRDEQAAALGPAAPLPDGPALGLSPLRLLVLAAIGCGVVAVLVAQHGLPSFFVSRARTSAILAGIDERTPVYLIPDKGLLLLMSFLAQNVTFVALYLILYARRNRLWRPDVLIGRQGWRAVIAALIVANLIINNPAGTGRWWFCLAAVCFASVYLPVHRRRNVILYAAGAVLVLIVAFSFLDYFRTTERITVGHGLNSDSYPVLQTGLNGEAFIDEHGTTDGLQLTGAILGLVPGSLWEGKPIPTGQVTDPQVARSASFWTELQVNFGLPGIVIGFGVWGGLAALADRRMGNPRAGLVPAFLLLAAVFQMFWLRGSLQPALGTLYQLAFLFAVVATTRSASPTGAAEAAP